MTFLEFQSSDDTAFVQTVCNTPKYELYLNVKWDFLVERYLDYESVRSDQKHSAQINITKYGSVPTGLHFYYSHFTGFF